VSRAEQPDHSAGVAKSADGKLWFLPLEGVSVIDPRHLPFNDMKLVAEWIRLQDEAKLQGIGRTI
jgi:hypothetical protein